MGREPSEDSTAVPLNELARLSVKANNHLESSLGQASRMFHVA